MFIVNSYTLAIIFCFITMICWGSWGNTQKLASKNWRYELYYWDYTIGILLFALLLVFTLGSFGDSGRVFLETRVRDNILKSKEQKNIQPTKGGHKMVTCQNYVSLFYRQITSCPSDGGIS